MAELRVEKKTPVWPWIVVALLIIGVIAWFLIDRGDVQVGNDGHTDQRNTEQHETRNNDPVTTR